MKAIGYITVIVAGLLFLPLVGTLAGAFVGWVVSLFGLAPIVLDALHRFGVDVDGWSLWQVGAALGFLGAFFRTSLTTKSPS